MPKRVFKPVWFTVELKEDSRQDHGEGRERPGLVPSIKLTVFDMVSRRESPEYEHDTDEEQRWEQSKRLVPAAQEHDNPDHAEDHNQLTGLAGNG